MRIPRGTGVRLVAVLMMATVVMTGCGESGDAGKSTEASSVITNTPEPSLDNPLVTIKMSKLTCSRSVPKKVELSWKAVDGVSVYEVLRSKEKDGTYEILTTTDKTEYTDKKTKAKKTYYYKVIGLQAEGSEITTQPSKALKVQVRISNPLTILSGECFVEDFEYNKNEFPSNFRFCGKRGLNSYAMLNNNYFEYEGQTMTLPERLAAYNADRIYLMIGANESDVGDPNNTIDNVDKLDKMIRKVKPDYELVLMCVPPMARKSSQNIPTLEKRRKYNDVYKNYCDSHDDVYYCDATEIIADDEGYMQDKYDGGDGEHWSQSGTMLIIDELEKWSKNTFGNW